MVTKPVRFSSRKARFSYIAIHLSVSYSWCWHSVSLHGSIDKCVGSTNIPQWKGMSCRPASHYDTELRLRFLSYASKPCHHEASKCPRQSPKTPMGGLFTLPSHLSLKLSLRGVMDDISFSGTGGLEAEKFVRAVRKAS